MFDRFDDSAKQPLMMAREEARRLGHEYVDTEHLLLGLLKTGGFVLDVLWVNHVDPDEVRRIVEERHPSTGNPKLEPGQLAFSPWVADAIVRAGKETVAGGTITGGHLLLGLLLEPKGLAGQVLRERKVDPAELRKRL